MTTRNHAFLLALGMLLLAAPSEAHATPVSEAGGMAPFVVRENETLINRRHRSGSATHEFAVPYVVVFRNAGWTRRKALKMLDYAFERLSEDCGIRSPERIHVLEADFTDPKEYLWVPHLEPKTRCPWRGCELIANATPLFNRVRWDKGPTFFFVQKLMDTFSFKHEAPGLEEEPVTRAIGYGAPLNAHIEAFKRFWGSVWIGNSVEREDKYPTLAHEAGHLLGLPHKTGTIMHDGFCVGPGCVPFDWEAARFDHEQCETMKDSLWVNAIR